MDKTPTPKAPVRHVPYDTGKVKIGIFYEPPKPQPEEHELLLQNVLLGTEQHKEPVLYRIIANMPTYAMFAVAFVLYVLILFRS